MTAQKQRAAAFAALHVSGHPLILFNAWDAGSAKVLAQAGSKAIATGSWSVAAAHGVDDGEKLSLDLALANAARIVRTVDLPVTIDFEGGYGQDASQLAEAFTKLLVTGAIGANVEDQIMGIAHLFSVSEQATRIRALRAASERASVAAFINARTDIFLKASPDQHSDILLQSSVERAKAYADAGASGFFAPGLRDLKQIETLCQQSTLPVNIMMMPGMPTSKQLADVGVARISYGPSPYRLAMAALSVAAQQALSY